MLNDAKCRNAKPASKPYKLTDERGLYLEIKPSGTKTWRYRFELGGKESTFTIGEYAVPPAGETAEQTANRKDSGDFTLSEARDERAKARALVKRGINPVQHRQLKRIEREQENATTFEAVAREWVSLRDWEEVTKTRRLDMLKRVVFPKIGSLPVRQVKPAHVLDVLTTVVSKNGLSVAEEAKRTMSGVFELAVATLRADTDPVYFVRKALPKNKTQHKRPLSIEEIGLLMRHLDGYHGNFQTVAAFRLMWMTLCRPNEVVEAKWDEFHLGAAIWRIPSERMKKRKEHLIPLPRQAVELLSGIRGVTGHLAHVFPHRDDRTKPMTGNVLRMALHNLGWSGKYSPHATRTTGSTRLNEMGYAPDWIERQLAHAEQNAVRRTYNHAEYLEQRKDMMQRWADMLDTWKNGAEVVPRRLLAA